VQLPIAKVSDPRSRDRNSSRRIKEVAGADLPGMYVDQQLISSLQGSTLPPDPRIPRSWSTNRAIYRDDFLRGRVQGVVHPELRREAAEFYPLQGRTPILNGSDRRAKQRDAALTP
jgi:hypothetical protein